MNRCPQCGHKWPLGQKLSQCPKCQAALDASSAGPIGGATLVGEPGGFGEFPEESVPSSPANSPFAQDVERPQDTDASAGPIEFDPRGTLQAGMEFAGGESAEDAESPASGDSFDSYRGGTQLADPAAFQTPPPGEDRASAGGSGAGEPVSADSAPVATPAIPPLGQPPGEKTIAAPQDATHREQAGAPQSVSEGDVTRSGGGWGSVPGSPDMSLQSPAGSDPSSLPTQVGSGAGLGQPPGETPHSGDAAAPDPFQGPAVSLSSVVSDSAAASSGSDHGATQVGGSTGGHGSEVGEGVKKLWESFSESNFGPMASLKSDSMGIGRDEGLVIRRRGLIPADAPDSEDADYKVLRYLGQGAMGVVFEAKQTAMQRDVAVKTLRPELARKASDRQKFLYEASITGDLDHPNIVPIHDVGVNHDGTLFYSMKRVEGTPWQNVMQSKSRAENIDILMKVADAVAFAHSRHVIHRDLKPENIMLGQFGEVLVMDWGLAVNLARGKDFVLGGTPAYMAPEMARHQLPLIDQRSDIYLLGAMLYQVITGYPPHPGETVTQCVAAAARNVIIPVETPDELLKIALTAMATAPSDRYPTVAEFQEAIRQYEEHAESIKLTDRADEELEYAIERGEYAGFSRARFGYEDAVKLWPENSRAEKGLKQAKLAHADEALRRNDFDLGMSLLNPHDPDDALLYEQLAKGKADRESQRKRAKAARQSAFIFMGVALAVAIVGAFFVNQQREVAVVERQKAEAAFDQAEQERIKATEATEEALIQKKKAEDLADETRRQAIELQAKTDELESSNEQLTETAAALKVQRDVATNALTEAREARIEAEDKSLESLSSNVDSTQARLASEQAGFDSLTTNLAVLLGRFKSDLTLSKSDLEDWNYEAVEPRLRELLQGGQENPYPISFKDWEAYRLLYRLNSARPALEKPLDDFFDVALSADGKRYAVALKTGQLVVGEVRGEKPLQTFDIPFVERLTPVCVALNPDGSQVVAGTKAKDEPNLFFWDVDTGQPLAAQPEVGHRSGTVDVRFADDSTLLTAGLELKSPFRTMRVFRRDTSDGVFAKTRSGSVNYRENRCVDVSGDGQRVLVLEDYFNRSYPDLKRVCALYLQGDTGGRAPVIIPYRGVQGYGAIHDAMFDPTDPSGSRIFLATDDGLLLRVTLISLPDPNPENAAERIATDQHMVVERFEGHDRTRPVLSLDVALTAAGASGQPELRVISGGQKGDLILWDVINRKPRKALAKHPAAITDCGFLAEGQQVYSVCGDQRLRLWTARGVKDTLALLAPPSQYATGSPDIIAHDSSSQRPWLAGVDRFGYVNVWSQGDERLLGRWRVEQELGRPMHACYYPDTQRLLVATVDGMTRVWDVEQQVVLSQWAVPGGFDLIAHSQNGRFVGQGYAAGGDDEGYRIIDLAAPPEEMVSLVTRLEMNPKFIAAGEEKGALRLANVQQLAISDDGLHLAFGINTRVIHYDREQRRVQIADARKVQGVEGFAFLPATPILLLEQKAGVGILTPGEWSDGQLNSAIDQLDRGENAPKLQRYQLKTMQRTAEGGYRLLVTARITPTRGGNASDEPTQEANLSAWQILTLPPANQWSGDLSRLQATRQAGPVTFSGEWADAELTSDGQQVLLVDQQQQAFVWQVAGPAEFQPEPALQQQLAEVQAGFAQDQGWVGNRSDSAAQKQLDDFPRIDHMKLYGQDVRLVAGQGYAALLRGDQQRPFFRVHPAGPARSLRFIPGSTELVVTHSDGRVRRWELVERESSSEVKARLMSQLPGDFRQAVPDAAGNLVLLDSAGRLFYRDRTQGDLQAIQTSESPQRSVTTFAWRPANGSTSGWLVAGTRAGHLRLVQQVDASFSLAPLPEGVQLPVLGSDISAVDISPDGRYLAVGSDRGEARLLVIPQTARGEFLDLPLLTEQGIQSAELEGATEAQQATLIEAQRIASLQFSPTGQRLLISKGQEATLWHLYSGSADLVEQMYRLTHEQLARVARFSPDGSLIATAPANLGRVRVWPAVQWSRDLHTQVASEWSPSGKTIDELLAAAQARIRDAEDALANARNELADYKAELEQRRADEANEAADVEAAAVESSQDGGDTSG